jgi:hypothetical protein
MSTIVAHRVGEEGYVHFLHVLLRLGVLDRDDVLAHLRLHGAVIRRAELPVDEGDGADEEALEALADELGGELT